MLVLFASFIGPLALVWSVVSFCSIVDYFDYCITCDEATMLRYFPLCLKLLRFCFEKISLKSCFISNCFVEKLLNEYMLHH